MSKNIVLFRLCLFFSLVNSYTKVKMRNKKREREKSEWKEVFKHVFHLEYSITT